MTAFSAVMFSKSSDEWSTPQDVYDALDSEFHFDTDAAASECNRKCANWFGPGGSHEDALSFYWPRFKTYWLNPPYSRCREFIDKASREASAGSTVVCLVPSRTDTRWWHEHVWDKEMNQTRHGVEMRFIKGRVRFSGASAGAPFPSVVIVFRPYGIGQGEK